MNIKVPALGATVEFLANALTIVGGILGLYAIMHPETIATYLDRISGNVETIAESVPRWPVINGVAYSVSRPSSATLAVELVNPRNVLIEEFSGTAAFELEGELVFLPLGETALIPPNEEVVLSNNFIRQSWFPMLEKQPEVKVQFCFGGRLEGASKRFYENREYILKPKQQVLSLSARSFSSKSDELCELS